MKLKRKKLFKVKAWMRWARFSSFKGLDVTEHDVILCNDNFANCI